MTLQNGHREAHAAEAAERAKNARKRATDELIRAAAKAVAIQFGIERRFDREALAAILLAQLGPALEVAAEARADHELMEIARKEHPTMVTAIRAAAGTLVNERSAKR